MGLRGSGDLRVRGTWVWSEPKPTRNLWLRIPSKQRGSGLVEGVFGVRCVQAASTILRLALRKNEAGGSRGGGHSTNGQCFYLWDAAAKKLQARGWVWCVVVACVVCRAHALLLLYKKEQAKQRPIIPKLNTFTGGIVRP